MRSLLLVPALLAQTPEFTPDGFRIPSPNHAFRFPADHGSHPDFRSEWWYYTGLLHGADGSTFGFQLTFFRQAAPKAPWTGSTNWRSDEIHLAHAALTDLTAKAFAFEERLNRAGLLAQAETGRLRVFNAAWSAEEAAGLHRLKFQVKGRTLHLDLRPLTPPVIFGEKGVSRKGEDPTACSHYVTFPRMAATGTLTGPEGMRPVTGAAWMDHEWSSNQLAPGQVGWDWAGLRLKDGHALMAYRLRRADGRADAWSTLTEVDADGHLLRTTRDWALRPLGQWTSPSSGATYPLPLALETWGEHWTLEPLLPDQELRTRLSNGITYWEGACRVRNGSGAECGEGYVELTGYAASLAGRF